MAESGDSSVDITIIAIIWNEDYAEDIFYPEIVYHFKDNDGIVKDYFYFEEYKFLEERVLEIVRELKPELKDQL